MRRFQRNLYTSKDFPVKTSRSQAVFKSMIKFAVGIAEKLNSFIGCRFLTVDAKAGALIFYEKLGFEVLVEKPDRPVPMYLDLLSRSYSPRPATAETKPSPQK